MLGSPPLTPQQSATRWLSIWNTPNAHLRAASSNYDDELSQSLTRASAEYSLEFLSIVLRNTLFEHALFFLAASVVEDFLIHHSDRLSDLVALSPITEQFDDLISGVWADDRNTPEVIAFIAKYQKPDTLGS